MKFTDVGKKKPVAYDSITGCSPIAEETISSLSINSSTVSQDLVSHSSESVTKHSTTSIRTVFFFFAK